MGKGLSDLNEMTIIYETSKDVYEGKYSAASGIGLLKGKVSGTQASIKMYFDIYSCMRNGKCYKMGTSEAYTKFLLNSIYKDFGEEAYKKALSSVRGNYAYRESVNNKQQSLIRACEESLMECMPSLKLDAIPVAEYKSKKDTRKSKKKRKAGRNKTVGFGEKVIMPIDGSTKEENNQSNSFTYSIISGEDEFTPDVMELNMQPPASILSVFSRLSYKPWYAIAEFVDNSTQSYLSHCDELKDASDFDKLIVDVRYNSQENTLTVTDNAYGMELERFRDAILLDSRNETQTGRNEFGMGLKTAASWFGKVWSITSTQYGSTNRYTATVDIPKLDEYHLQGTKIYRDYAAEDEHGTKIVIEQVTKKITASRTIVKIKDLLSSMYRRDINNNDVEIWFNGEPIEFEEYPILTNFRGKTWKKDLDFTVYFDDKTYHVTGFVAIMNPGSFPKAGFALFRQDRVVIGGTDNNYKPDRIFGQAQSQKSLKLFGELNMNDFPVNQAKDGFIWDDGLEDAFIEALRDNIQEYITIADLSKNERASEMQFSDSASRELQQNVSEVIDSAFGDDNADDELNDENEENEIEESQQDTDQKEAEQDNSDYNEYLDTVLNVEPAEEFVSIKREYHVPLSPVLSVNFSVQWARGSKKYWIEYNETEDDFFEVLINIDHPFFMPFTKTDGFQKVLEKFALAFILAERQAKLASDKHGYIQNSVIKNYMNNYLEKLAEDE